jgi:ActR/RegA family two-component response regulator
MADKPSILLIGNDPSLEYLLERYAYRGGYHLQSIHAIVPEVNIGKIKPKSIWFSSLDVLEAYQPQREAILAYDVPIVVCSSIADDARAMDLGADYLLLHPLTYDSFLNALNQE